MPRYEKTTATVMVTSVGTFITGGSRASYRPVVQFRYEVNGRQYTSDRFSQNVVGISVKGAVERTLSKYPPNSTTEIFYNVDNPQDAFIERGSGNTMTAVLLIIMILVIIGLIWFLNFQGVINLF